MLREVSPHALTLWTAISNFITTWFAPCCKSVQDIEGEFIDFQRLSRQLPDLLDLTQPLIEVMGSVAAQRYEVAFYAVPSQDSKEENIWKIHSRIHREVLSPKLRKKIPQPNRSAQ